MTDQTKAIVEQVDREAADSVYRIGRGSPTFTWDERMAVDEADVEAALAARVPGGSSVYCWLPMADGHTIHQTARDVMRSALAAVAARHRITATTTENEALKARVAALEGALGLASRNAEMRRGEIVLHASDWLSIQDALTLPAPHWRPAMSEDDKLLPCPFCGNDGSGPIEEALHIAHTQNDWHPAYDCYCVQCDKCTATMGYSDSADAAIAAWNTRAPLSAPDEGEVERVAVALVNAERAEHGLRPCRLDQLFGDDETKYRNRARAAIAAIRGGKQ